MVDVDTVIEEACGRKAIESFAESIPEDLWQEVFTALDLTNCGTDDHCGLYVVRRNGTVAAVAPRLLRTTNLPVRMGEKVLWRPRLPAALIHSLAQNSFSAEKDGAALLSWMRITHPQLALFFPDLITETPLCDAVMKGPEFGYRIAGPPAAKHLFHRFRESYDAFFEEKRSKYKNQLRKKEKTFLERAGSNFHLQEYRTADDVGDFLAAADQINKKTYQYGLFGESVDNDDRNREKYSKLARCGEFRSFVLWHQEAPLCFVLGLQKADRVFRHVMTGFDPDWRNLAPGINCNILMLRQLYEEDRPRVLDFGSGDADYKRLFSNETRHSWSPILVPDIPAYSLIYGLHIFSARLNEIAVNVLQRTGIKDRIKRILRQRASSRTSG